MTSFKFVFSPICLNKVYNEETIYLATPGPVEIHPKVYTAMNQHLYHHRTPHFKNIYAESVEMFQKTIVTNRPIQIHSGSGSLGLHAAITNLVDSSDFVLNLVNGKFGERVEQISKRFTSNNESLKVEYGAGISPELLKETLEKFPDTSIVTITHNETSTGVLNPLPELSKIINKHGALLVADCITSAGGDEVLMDKWGIDFFVSGSQKCYGLPPGLAFIAISEKAQDKIENNPEKKDFYSDIAMFAKKSLGETPFTPANGLIYGLHASLSLILEEGMEARIHRHRRMGRFFRNAMESLGLELFAEEKYRSNTVTSTYVPENLDSGELIGAARKLGVLLANGQGTMKGKTFRMGHMNLVGPRELLMITSVIELALKSCGADISLGKGVSVIQEGLID